MTIGQRIVMLLSAIAGVFLGKSYAGNLGAIVGLILFSISSTLIYSFIVESLR